MKPTLNLRNINVPLGDKTIKIEHIHIEFGDVNMKDALVLAKEIPSLLKELKK